MSTNGNPSAGPQPLGILIGDIMAGMYAVIASVTALYHRDMHRGGGQAVDLSLLDAVIATMGDKFVSYLITGDPPQQADVRQMRHSVPHQLFPCADGEIFVSAPHDVPFARLCGLLGRPELAADPRFLHGPERVANADLLIPELSAVFRRQTLREWMDKLVAADIICAPINDVPAAIDDPQIRARGMIKYLDHPVAGRIPTIANPIRFSEVPLDDFRAAPELGVDTESVLTELLAMSPQEIARLRAEKAI
jgi:crotonobetainyl-CoA:carnitine CoA-transferase CaiB-like acyl-CoA transferase